MKKVYVVVESWQIDGETGEEVCVFENYTDATIEAFGRRNKARNDFNHMDCDEDEGETSWSIYQQGNYMLRRDTITVYEREIN